MIEKQSKQTRSNTRVFVTAAAQTAKHVILQKMRFAQPPEIAASNRGHEHLGQMTLLAGRDGTCRL